MPQSYDSGFQAPDQILWLGSSTVCTCSSYLLTEPASRCYQYIRSYVRPRITLHFRIESLESVFREEREERHDGRSHLSPEGRSDGVVTLNIRVIHEHLQEQN